MIYVDISFRTLSATLLNKVYYGWRRGGSLYSLLIFGSYLNTQAAKRKAAIESNKHVQIRISFS